MMTDTAGASVLPLRHRSGRCRVVIARDLDLCSRGVNCCNAVALGRTLQHPRRQCVLRLPPRTEVRKATFGIAIL